MLKPHTRLHALPTLQTAKGRMQTLKSRLRHGNRHTHCLRTPILSRTTPDLNLLVHGRRVRQDLQHTTTKKTEREMGPGRSKDQMEIEDEERRLRRRHALGRAVGRRSKAENPIGRERERYAGERKKKSSGFYVCFPVS